MHVRTIAAATFFAAAAAVAPGPCVASASGDDTAVSGVAGEIRDARYAQSTASKPDERIDPEAVLEQVADMAPDLLSRYIRIDTTNSPGTELEGVRLLSEVLAADGIESTIFESAPGRGNLYARLEGTGARRPIILLSHVDVVPVDAGRWKRPPLGGVIADGAVHGRGALDAKGIGVTQLLAMVAIKRLGVPLTRDVILLATAGEETGGALGAGWMVEHEFERLADAEFVLNEGGFIRREPGRSLIYNLNAAEKGPCWFKVTASGPPGHASRPAGDTAVTRLVDALARLVAWKRPYEVGPVVAGYYAAYALLDSDHARQFRQLDRSLEDEDFYDWFMSDPGAAALVQDTLTPTVLEGSKKTNVIPTEAVARVDSRLLPGHDCDEFLTTVRDLIGSQHVRVERDGVAFPSSQSPLHNALTRAMERVAAADEERAVVLPGLQSGFTDSHYFRAKGINAYGFTPIVVTAEQRDAVHGPNENVGVDALRDGVRRMTRFLEEISR